MIFTYKSPPPLRLIKRKEGEEGVISSCSTLVYLFTCVKLFRLTGNHYNTLLHILLAKLLLELCKIVLL